jgi:hypothetical protein
MAQAYRDKALDTFVRGLKRDLTRLLIVKEPEDMRTVGTVETVRKMGMARTAETFGMRMKVEKEMDTMVITVQKV